MNLACHVIPLEFFPSIDLRNYTVLNKYLDTVFTGDPFPRGHTVADIWTRGDRG